MKADGRGAIARHWHAGELGCGAFIAQLKREMNQIQRGEMLCLTSGNAGAPSDLPAWCRMTGHTLVSADHPVYVIEKGAR
jgi:tRNA 2-thiouridine synthesizing protein A